MSVSNLEKLRLKLDSDGDGTIERTYDIYPIQSVDISSTKEAFSIAPPGLAARENILLGISGMQADITISAQTWEDPSGTDRANGTHTSSVVTTGEQNAYLEKTMHAPDFSAAWQLDHLTGDAFNDDPVFFEGVDLNPIDRQTPKWDEISIRLRRGQSIG
jgi:hypothetical protein